MSGKQRWMLAHDMLYQRRPIFALVRAAPRLHCVPYEVATTGGWCPAGSTGCREAVGAAACGSRLRRNYRRARFRTVSTSSVRAPSQQMRASSMAGMAPRSAGPKWNLRLSRTPPGRRTCCSPRAAWRRWHGRCPWPPRRQSRTLPACRAPLRWRPGPRRSRSGSCASFAPCPRHGRGRPRLRRGSVKGGRAARGRDIGRFSRG